MGEADDEAVGWAGVAAFDLNKENDNNDDDDADDDDADDGGADEEEGASSLPSSRWPFVVSNMDLGGSIAATGPSEAGVPSGLVTKNFPKLAARLRYAG